MGFLVGALITIITATLVAIDASKRGMHAGTWFAGVLLLMCVALPMYFIQRKPLITHPYQAPFLEPQAVVSPPAQFPTAKRGVDKTTVCIVVAGVFLLLVIVAAILGSNSSSTSSTTTSSGSSTSSSGHAVGEEFSSSAASNDPVLPGGPIPSAPIDPWLPGVHAPSSSAASNITSSPSAPSYSWKVGAQSYYVQYRANEVAADNKFKDKQLLVTGVVISITKDIGGGVHVALLGGNNDFETVDASLKDDEAGQAASLRAGRVVSMICRGGTMIVTSPMLEDCWFYTPPAAVPTPPVSTETMWKKYHAAVAAQQELCAQWPSEPLCAEKILPPPGTEP